MSFVVTILKSCWQYKKLYGWAFVCLIITNLLASAIPYCLKIAVDYDQIQSSSFEAFRYPLYIVVFAFLQFVFRSLSRIFVYRACREQENDMRLRLSESVLRIPLRELEKRSGGDLVTNLNEDTTQVRIFVGFGFVQLANILLVYSICIPFMLSISTTLTWYAVLPYPFLLVFIAYLNQKLYYKNLETKEKLADLTEFSAQTIHGVHVVKSFQAYKGMAHRFQDLVQRHFDISWTTAKIDSLLLPGLILIASMGEYFLLKVGVPMMVNDQITKGDFLAIHGYISYILFASISVGFGMSTFNRGFTSFKRLEKVFSIQEQPPTLNLDSDEKLESLEFKDLVYTHEGSKGSAALKVVDLELEVGQMIGVCGPIGCGKSTLYRVLQGLDQNYEGEILFKGKKGNYSPLELRNRFSVVSQEVFLFSHTIHENLSLLGEMSEEEAWRAIEMADFRSDVEGFPRGLDTVVGEKGVKLSLGQKQRLSIARALAHPQEFMIFDDCFSALDTVTEEKILQNLLKLKGEHTIFLTSHRISTLKHCDQIIVLEGGQISSRGSHEELLKEEGYYQHVDKVQRQFGEGA